MNDGNFAKSVIEASLRKLTENQRSLLLEACHRPVIGSSGASISNVKAEDLHAMGGLIGTLKRDKIQDRSIIKPLKRDKKGRWLYGINEEVVDRKTLANLLKKIEEY